MSDRRLKLSTTASLFPPVEIEIDGAVYSVRMNYATFARLSQLEAEYRENIKTIVREGIEVPEDAWAATLNLYEQVAVMTGIPDEKIRAFGVDELRAIINHITAKYVGKLSVPEAGVADEADKQVAEAVPGKKPKNV